MSKLSANIATPWSSILQDCWVSAGPVPDLVAVVDGSAVGALLLRLLLPAAVAVLKIFKPLHTTKCSYQSINQLKNKQPNNQSIKQTIYQSTDPPIHELINQSLNNKLIITLGWVILFSLF